MKVYFVEFTHKQTKKKFHKFGITKYGDVLKRFTAEESARFGNNPNQYSDFDIRVIASAWTNTTGECEQQEKFLQRMFPKNIWVEDYLAVKDKQYKFSGVTEVVSLSETEVELAKKYFYRLRKDWGNDQN